MSKCKHGNINDIDLSKWNSPEYQDIITDSLWIINKRDNSGLHIHGANYPGNFVPQIPNQFIRRFTKKGDCVLDPMCGSGTTLIEAEKLNRNAMGIDLNISYMEQYLSHLKYNFSQGNALLLETYEIFPINFFDLIICHPPYHNIIKYSDNNKDDLSSYTDIDDYINSFAKVIYNCRNYLKTNKYLVVVIGDIYTKQEHIPLAFKIAESISTLHYCHNIFIDYIIPEEKPTKFLLKSTIVKNFGETKGKKNQQNLWRYRALANGLYVFKHEYILLFQKVELTKKEIQNNSIDKFNEY